MKKLLLIETGTCENCLDCEWSQDIWDRSRGTAIRSYVCQCPKATEKEMDVSDYIQDGSGVHPKCPLPSLPDGVRDEQKYITDILANHNSREMRTIKT